MFQDKSMSPLKCLDGKIISLAELDQQKKKMEFLSLPNSAACIAATFAASTSPEASAPFE